jgi:EAL domain-containing protein (putative c-di-GMP-specific phosphodiesterase class I)
MVETREVAERVKELGIDFGQGYFYGKPEMQPVAQASGLLGRVLFRGKRKNESRWG